MTTTAATLGARMRHDADRGSSHTARVTTGPWSFVLTNPRLFSAIADAHGEMSNYLFSAKWMRPNTRPDHKDLQFARAVAADAGAPTLDAGEGEERAPCSWYWSFAPAPPAPAVDVADVPAPSIFS